LSKISKVIWFLLLEVVLGDREGKIRSLVVGDMMTEYRMLFGNGVGDTVETIVRTDNILGRWNGPEAKIESGLAQWGFMRLDKPETFIPTSYWKLFLYALAFDAVAWIGIDWLLDKVLADGVHTQMATAAAWIAIAAGILLSLFILVWPEYQARNRAAERKRIREMSTANIPTVLESVNV
jgi:hypothetical protein